MAISPQCLTISLYSAHRAVIFAIAQLSCYNKDWIDWIGLGEKVKNPENVKSVRIIKCVKVSALFVNIKCVSHVRNNYEYQSRCAMLVARLYGAYKTNLFFAVRTAGWHCAAVPIERAAPVTVDVDTSRQHSGERERERESGREREGDETRRLKRVF